MKILFVCQANMCRSVMAEALFDQESKKQGLDADVNSAGLMGFAGTAPTFETVSVMKDAGVDVKDHETRPLSPSDIRDSELVITMTQAQKELILKKIGQEGTKILTLSESAGDDAGDIMDPTEKEEKKHVEIRDQISGLVGRLVGRIKAGELP